MIVVAEGGLSHDGSLGMAYALTDAVAKAGAHAIKWQVHQGDKVDQFRRGCFFPADRTRQDFWQRTAFTQSQWRGLRNRAAELGIQFGVSTFAVEGIELMRPLKPDFWKVPSGLTSNTAYLDAVRDTEAPVVLSTGMSTLQETWDAKQQLHGCRELTILQCTSEYPCPPERIGLGVLDEFRGWGCKVGLSDHSGEIWPGIAAAVDGADMLEVHVTWSKDAFGPDVRASLTIEQLRELVRGVRFVERMQGPYQKDAVSGELEGMRRIFRKDAN